MNIVAQLEEYVAKSLAEAEKRVERFNNALCEANEGKQPTRDCQGRLHAPCDGYIFDDRDYLGGQYLHTPEDVVEAMQEMGFGGGYDPDAYLKRGRIKAQGDDFDAIAPLLSHLAIVSRGKEWEGGNYYIYVKTSRASLITVIKAIEESQKVVHAEKQAEEKGTAPTGRTEVRGIVASIKEVEGYYGYTTKMFVILDNKSTVYGTVPASLEDAERGSVIQFTATFAHAEDDTTHAFYKRPSKAVILKEEAAI